ncbi:hypothetical protein [Methylobacterium sp. J-076]|uniref:hypothetical protein n=1 Tax=Methylobacterium sp. J-076 TaxID=2836655 RepID=UPI001FBA2E98|nr:hypothetical protein [Methylobacterium sp. J-076]MCJ2011215.1 hypothetical protein [Methylobacterium sp. J-076]
MTAETDPPPGSPDGAASPGGWPRPIRLPPHWHAWFARQTEGRLAMLDELVDERIERRVLRDALRRLKHAVVVAFVGAAAVAHWFADQAAWVADRLPLLRHLWALIAGEGR